MSDQEEQKPSKKSIPDLRATSNVVPLPVPKKSEKGPKAKDIQHTIAQAMCGVTHGWPPFQATLHKVVDHRGEALIYQEKDGIIRELSPLGLDSLISDYWQKILPDGPRPISLGAMSADDARKIRQLWLITAKAKKNDFPLIVWKSDPRPAHHRLPFDPIPLDQLQNAAPLFAELMSRTSNSAGLMAFIGSLLDDRSQRQQYVWMYGEGGNGKGALVRALTSVLGQVVASEQVPGKDAKHWTSGLIGKRLVYFPDCNNASFVTSGLFKSLSGEDRIRVEIKAGAILSLDLPLKFLFVSNKKPYLSSQKSDMRRVIYCGVGPVTGEVDGYEDKLAKEVPAILSACWWSYLAETNQNPRALYPVGNQEEVKELAEDAEHEFAAFVDHCLVIDSESSTEQWVRAGDMLELMTSFGFKTPYERRTCRDYLARVHGIECKKIRQQSKVFLAYIKCAKSPTYELQFRKR